jgi:hypothetical protein
MGINGQAMTLVTVTKEGQVVDSFNGVKALYRPGGSDGSDATYSCAALVKKYYQKMYGVTPYNLLTNATPTVDGSDQFVEVSKPAVGDIVRCTNSSGVSSHWAIVQAVTDSEVILLEQNWKWQDNGVTYAKADRNLDKDSSKLHYFRLESQNKVSTESTASSTETGKTTETSKTTEAASKTSTASGKRTLKLNHSDVTLRYGKKETCYIKGTIKNKRSGDKLVYSSSNKKIATVSSKGKVTPKKKKGKCTITVKVKGTNVKKTCIVRVKK